MKKGIFRFSGLVAASLLPALLSFADAAAGQPGKDEAAQQLQTCLSILAEPEDRLVACANAQPKREDQARLDILFVRAELLEEVGRREEAIAVADQIASISPMNWIAHNSKCWYRAVANIDLDVAKIACDEAVRLQPESADALNSSGLVSLRRKEWLSAWQYYDRAAKIRGSAANVYGRGLASLAAGRSFDAKKDLWEGRFVAPFFASLGLDPFSISDLSTDVVLPRSNDMRRLKPPVRLKSNVKYLELIIDKEVVTNWQLVDSLIPDIFDISQNSRAAMSQGPVEVCLRTNNSKACQEIAPNETGVYIIRYKGSNYLAHFTR